MSEPLPQLPRPEFTVIHIGSSPEVPINIANQLRETGIPSGLIGYEYRPLTEAEYISAVPERGLVAIGTSGLLGRICLDAATGEVVHIPKVEAVMVGHVNLDLKRFTECVSAVIGRFPFYDEDEDDEKFQEAADEIRGIITAIDDTAFVHNGFWHTFCEDVALGDYSTWD